MNTGHLLRKAMAWFDDPERPLAFTARLVGPDETWDCHTLACLYGISGGRYLLFNHHSASLSPQEVRRQIAELQVPAERLAEQRAVVARLLPAVTDDAGLAAAASTISMAYGLPTAFIAFGYTNAGNVPVTFMQSIVLAPPELVLEQFRSVVSVDPEAN